MKIKLKTQSLDDWELNLFESYSTLPIIIGRTMIFGAYNVDFEMTDNIWHQLPEEYKKKIYKYNLKKLIKSMLITVTDITAYSFCFGCNVKLKKSLIMEEIYEDFDENKKINFLTPGCDFPKSSMSVYFQYLGEVYAEVELDELVAISDEENSFQYSIMPKLMEASNYRKRRENRTGKLEKIYNEQLIVKSLVDKNIDELSKEKVQKILENFLLIDDLKYLVKVIKKSKKLEVIISDKLKNEIKHWLRDIQIKIKTEEDEKIYQELKEILKEQL
ncbi:stage V sporulation protein K [Fusobacterium polymorphum]|nr:stage V sporulation protein K [Fusobacterium polymorphum]WRL78508.1 stage V sporulation protein K [Fusobacterium polymorphum]